MKATLFLVCILLLIGPGGCGDDDPTSVNPDPLLFVIHVVVNETWEGTLYLTVDLAMENPGQVPSFSANGDSVSGFLMHGNNVQGRLNIPHAETVEFTVNSMNREISGAIEVPRIPDVVMCNGIELNDGLTNEMAASGRYEFTWSGGKADYFHNSMRISTQSGAVSYHDLVEGEEWTVEEPRGVPVDYYIVAVSGSLGNPGEMPNISSSWAEGYIFTRHHSDTYKFYTPSRKQEDRVVESAMEQLERILEYRNKKRP